MKRSFNLPKNRIGAVFFWAVLMIGILGIMAGALAKVVSKDVFTAQYLKYSTQAFMLADAGISHAFSQLKADFNNTATITSSSLSLGGYDGAYNVTITANEANRLATSVGTVKGVSRTVVAEFSGPPSYEAFNYAVFVNRNILNVSILWGLTTINGDMFANNNVTLMAILGNTININGSVYAYGGDPVIRPILGSINISGEHCQANNTIPFPTLDFEYYRNLAQNGGLYYSSSQTWRNVNLNPGNGVIYVNGNVTFQRNNNITGCLVVNGGVSINAATNLTQGKKAGYLDLPAIACQRNIEGSGELNFNGLVYSRGGSIYAHAGESNGGCLMASQDVSIINAFRTLTTTWSLENPPDLVQNPVAMVGWSE